MASVAKAVGCWLFEYGPFLIMARPSWLIKQGWGGRLWDFGWNNWADYSEGLAGMPEYSKDPNSNPAESLTVRILSPDADECRPGDTVGISGNVGDMYGRWLVTAVTYPMKVGDVVTATCVRPIDPVIPPEPVAKPAAGVSGAPGALTGGNKSAPGVDGWMARTEGKSIDLDGAYGAQCVDLVQLYNTEFIRGVHISGNGNQWYDNPAVLGSYERVYKDSPPEKGDIACWGSFYGGGYGHVAIVVANAGASVRVFTQNPGGAHYDTLSKQGIQGWLRPKKLTYGTPNNGVVKWF
jgi:surface antigen